MYILEETRNSIPTIGDAEAYNIFDIDKSNLHKSSVEYILDHGSWY